MPMNDNQAASFNTMSNARVSVSWNELVLAFEFVSTGGGTLENQVLLCKHTGKFYWHSDWTDALDELPDDIDDGNKYAQIPNKRELDLGKPLVFDFASQFLPQDFDEVHRLFRRKGAYPKFKELLSRRGVLNQWYAFEAEAEEKALREWCAANAIEVTDEED